VDWEAQASPSLRQHQDYLACASGASAPPAKGVGMSRHTV